MRSRRIIGGIILVAACLPIGTGAQQKHPSNDRPASVRIDITNSRKRYDGSFTLAGTAKVCGEVPAMLNFAGVPSFIVQFYPDPPTGNEAVMDVTFSSKTLVGKVTTTGAFNLSVAVQSAAIGRPPAYVLDTTGPRKGSGTATATTNAKGDTVLRVVGANDMNESIDLTLTCGPRK